VWIVHALMGRGRPRLQEDGRRGLPAGGWHRGPPPEDNALGQPGSWRFGARRLSGNALARTRYLTPWAWPVPWMTAGPRRCRLVIGPADSSLGAARKPTGRCVAPTWGGEAERLPRGAPDRCRW